MAKAAKTKKPRKQKLKVFRTPIGFHDAYVAAASQKAALEAWGTDTNLFARGAAEEVTEPELMKEPLENPGEVFKRLRGSDQEQIAALGKEAEIRRAGRKKGASEPKRGMSKVRASKPSRAQLDKAEKRVETLERGQSDEVGKIDQDIEKLERRRRDMLRRHESARDELTSARDEARTAYERAMRKWEKG